MFFVCFLRCKNKHFIFNIFFLVKGSIFSPGTPVSPTNKTDCHDIAEILLKVALNTIALTLYEGLKYFSLKFGQVKKKLFRTNQK
jgi:hypothetical protein